MLLLVSWFAYYTLVLLSASLRNLAAYTTMRPYISTHNVVLMLTAQSCLTMLMVLSFPSSSALIVHHYQEWEETTSEDKVSISH